MGIAASSEVCPLKVSGVRAPSVRWQLVSSGPSAKQNEGSLGMIVCWKKIGRVRHLVVEADGHRDHDRVCVGHSAYHPKTGRAASYERKMK